MKLIKSSARRHPRISLILLDWSVRDSFQLLHYLRRQTVARDDFETIVIEYFDRVSEAIREFQDEIDTWALMEMPADCYYHKHLMYNAGIVLSRGDIVMICDSDALVRETFIESVIQEFDRQKDLTLHLDQFRNARRELYPFSYPTPAEVMGSGCINNAGGLTTGLADGVDPLHSRNYGACMCARRQDLIAIGGADEHIDFLGHICGPYDLSFRLANHGRRIVWHEKEFMYHTWHPGSDGVDNYCGPHDGRNVSTTSLESLVTGRVLPHQENGAIRLLREGACPDEETLIRHLMDDRSASDWRVDRLDRLMNAGQLDASRPLGRGRLYRGFLIREDGDRIMASPALLARLPQDLYGDALKNLTLDADSVDQMRQRIDLRLWRLWGARRFMLSAVVLWRSLRRILGSLRRDPSPTRVLRSAWRVLSSRDRSPLGKLMQEADFLREDMDSLVVNLEAARLVIQASPGTDSAVLLVDRAKKAGAMRLLMLAGLIPRFPVEYIADEEQLSIFLDSVAARGGNATVIATRSLYTRLSHLMASHPGMSRVWIA